MKKQIIKLDESEFEQILNENHSDYYLINEEIINYVDHNKNSTIVKAVVGQESTGKLFSYYYTQYSGDHKNYESPELTEVVAKKKTITVYE